MKLPVKTHSIVRNSILALISIAATAAANISLDFVTIGDPGNANDPSTGVFYDPSTGVFLNGSVNYTYYMGKYNVTLSQCTAFLNAVAQSDPYGLYDTSMTDPNIAGIARDGSPGSYSYSVIGSGQRPVTGVGWGDAARFANWLHNGQPMGLGEVAASTEQGAYTLNGITNNRSLLSISRNGNAQYWIPSEKEWYKAAYYDPNKGGSGVGGYWTYATMSDSMPGNVVGGGTQGNRI